MKNYKKIIILSILFIAIAGFALAPASAVKTSDYKYKVNYKSDVWGGGVIKNTPTKKVILYSGFNGINLNPEKTIYKKGKYLKYKVTYTSHGTIYDRNMIQKVTTKYRYYNYKQGKYLNKYSYKTIYAKQVYGGGNSVSYTSNKNWVPLTATVYMKNIKY